MILVGQYGSPVTRRAGAISDFEKMPKVQARNARR